MSKLSLLTYTNSKCADTHKIYFDSVNKFFTGINHFVLTDKNLDFNDIEIVLYDENFEQFHQQMIKGLSKIETEYVIYSQEDYILFDYVNLDKLNNIIDVLDKDDKINFIRLIYSGINFIPNDYNNDLIYLNPSNDYYYSSQITIWRVKDLIEMFENSKVNVIWDEVKNSNHLMNLGKVGLCVKEKGSKIGGHFNSIIYPYIATAIVKGKWNYSEYKKELDEIFNTYNIDKEIRGIR